MIRIDLSKNSEEKPSSNVAVPKELQDLATKVKLPPQILEFVTDVKRLAIVAVGTAIAMLPHLFFSQYRGYVISEQEKQLAKLKENLDAVNAEITKYGPFEKELESYEQQKKLVSERLAGVKALLDARSTPVNVLDAVGQSLPQKAWISKLSYDFKPELSQVKLEGTAYSNEDISDFLDKLSESIFLQEVKLSEVSSRAEGKVSMKTFKISTLPKARFPASAKEAPRATAAAPPPPAPAVSAAPHKSFFKKEKGK